MLESVVATFVAGIIGVMLAVAVVKSPWVEDVIVAGVSELPPFPLEAALIGLGTATVVGALAGLIPAVVAVRVKVIDAIRYWEYLELAGPGPAEACQLQCRLAADLRFRCCAPVTATP
jgi:hypothetical protein